MLRILILTLVLFTTVPVAVLASDKPLHTSTIPATRGQLKLFHQNIYYPGYRQVKEPIGWKNFCKKFSSECNHKTKSVIVKLSQGAWRKLMRHNNKANAEIVPATDQENYGVPELWTYPNGYGDCEDYVLVKKRSLIKAGWPPGSLLISIVINPEDSKQSHAVLIVRTSEGDLVLDNQTDKIVMWHETKYGFRMIQSADNPNKWLEVGRYQ